MGKIKKFILSVMVTLVSMVVSVMIFASVGVPPTSLAAICLVVYSAVFGVFTYEGLSRL